MSKLTDALILAAPLPTSGYKALTDGQRLFLRVTPDGARHWRLKYVAHGRESQASLGKYPTVSIAAARLAADELRRQVSDGKNPLREKRDIKEAIQDAKSLTFGRVAQEWLAYATTPTGEPWGERTTLKHKGEIEKLKSLRNLPIVDITSSHVMGIVQAIERTGKGETAKRVGQSASNVFSFAGARYQTGHNPARDRKFWLRAVKPEHHGALTDPGAVATLAGLIDGGWGGVGSPTVNNAMRFLLLTFPRQGELCSMEWAEVDFKTATWLAQPKAKSKLKAPHVVPLATQALAVLTAQKEISGAARYVWPHATREGRHMSTGTVAAALGTMGYTPEQHTAHGFRTTAATLLREALRFDSELVERQLSHKVGNAVAGAYDRSQRIDERRGMMQAWANYLDTLKTVTT
jgi:integrase